MGDRKVAPPTIEGVLAADRIGGGPYIGAWLRDRLADMPDGAYVRFTAEVLDPHPKENDGHRDRKGNDHDRTGN